MVLNSKIEPAIKLTQEERNKIIIDLVSREHNLRGNHLPTLKKAIEIIGYTDTTLALSEVAGLLSEISIGASAASAASALAALAFPIGSILAVIDARESGRRMYGMRAVAYTITAWTYEDPIPSESRTLIRNLTNRGTLVKPDELQAYHDA